MVIQKLSFLHHFKKYNRHHSQRSLTHPGLPFLPPGPPPGSSSWWAVPSLDVCVRLPPAQSAATPAGSSPLPALLPFPQHCSPPGPAAFSYSFFALRVRNGVFSIAFPSPKMGLAHGKRSINTYWINSPGDPYGKVAEMRTLTVRLNTKTILKANLWNFNNEPGAKERSHI